MNDEVLDNYGYPKRPCDTKCIETCIARLSCPMFVAWEKRIARDKEFLDIAEEQIKEARIDTFEKWYKRVNHLDEVNRIDAKAGWEAALETYDVKIICKIIEGGMFTTEEAAEVLKAVTKITKNSGVSVEELMSRLTPKDERIYGSVVGGDVKNSSTTGKVNRK